MSLAWARLLVALLTLGLLLGSTAAPAAATSPDDAEAFSAEGLGPNEVASQQLAEALIEDVESGATTTPANAPQIAEKRSAATPSTPGTTSDAAGAAATATVNPLGFSFRADPFGVRALNVEDRPLYSATKISLNDTGTHDSTGVRMYLLNGVMYDHPVAQAQYALQLLNNYRSNGNPDYLARAELQAHRLIDRRVVSRNAWYYPYPFNADSGANLLTAPWYSAMAQGLALAVFVWLSEMKGDAIYAQAATMTFNSFTNNRVSSGPWTVWVDGGGYLWLEEYPRAIPDQTINGSLFASFGLYEYFRWSGEPAAKKLMQGAYTTLRHYLPTISTGWISYYCLSHRNRNAFYHLVVTSQLNKIYAITAHTDFADWTERFHDEFPDYRIGGSVRFEAGTHTGYKFGTNGAITATKTATLASRSSAPAASRRTLEHRSGVWFEITSGTFAGYYIPEIPRKSYLPGKLAWLVKYNPLRSIWLAPGSYTAYQFGSDGSVTSSAKWTVATNTSVTASQRAVINGQKYRLIEDGPLAGRWLAIGAGSSRALVDRFGGTDRYATAAAISAASFDPGVSVAYLATGLDFPDALVGGPAAAKNGGPILLTRPDAIPQVVIDELTRLKPARIVLLGSTAVVSEAVAATAATLAPAVSRLGGRDRYATAAAVSAATFQPGVSVVYLATGANFPDALGGAAAAAKGGGGVLLVKPTAMPASTAAELARLRPARISILGSTGAVSDAVLNAARAYAPSVNRLAGRDRYATAVAISQATFGMLTTARAFVAVGTAFPDGLAISAVAGKARGPVLLVPKTSLLSNVASELRRLGPDRVTVAGSSSGAVSDSVAAAIRNLWP